MSCILTLEMNVITFSFCKKKTKKQWGKLYVHFNLILVLVLIDSFWIIIYWWFLWTNTTCSSAHPPAWFLTGSSQSSKTPSPFFVNLLLQKVNMRWIMEFHWDSRVNVPATGWRTLVSSWQRSYARNSSWPGESRSISSNTKALPRK